MINCTPLWHEARFQVKKTDGFGPLFDVQMSRKCTATTSTTTATTTTLQLHHTTRQPSLQLQIQLHHTTVQPSLQLQIQLHHNYTTTTLYNSTTLHYNYTTTTLQLHYTPLHYTPLHYIPLHYTTTLHYTTLHHTTLHYITRRYTILNCTKLHYNYKHNYNYASLHYTTLDYTTLHHMTIHYTSTIQLQIDKYTTLTTPHHNYNATALQLQLQLRYTTLHSAVVGEVTTATIAASPKKKHNSNHLLVPILKFPPQPCAVLLVFYSLVCATLCADSDKQRVNPCWNGVCTTHSFCGAMQRAKGSEVIFFWLETLQAPFSGSDH